MKTLRKLEKRDRIVAAAVRFFRSEMAQTSMEELRGTRSASAPGEFMLLMEAVEDYVRPAQAKLTRYIQEGSRRRR